MLFLSHVSLPQLMTDLIANGVPGAETMTTDFLPFTGQVSAPPTPTITQPAPIKLYNEYDYYLTEIRATGSFGVGTTNAPGGPAAGYVPFSEAAHLSFQIAADGRTRNLFRFNSPFSHFYGPQGPVPLYLPAPAAFAGSETVSCTVAFQGAAWAGTVILDFSVVLVCAVIKAGALKQHADKLRAGG